jgi:hypothetical protein
MSADDWIAIGTILLFLATLLGAIFVLVELRNGHNEAKDANSRAKKQATVDFYTQTLERRISWQQDFWHDRDAHAVGQMLARLKADPDSAESKTRRDRINSYLGFWELTAIAIKHEVFDENFFKDMLMTHFLQVEEHYRTFIYEARNEFGENGRQLYVEMEALAAAWRNPVPPRPRGIARFLRPGGAL